MNKEVESHRINDTDHTNVKILNQNFTNIPLEIMKGLIFECKAKGRTI